MSISAIWMAIGTVTDLFDTPHSRTPFVNLFLGLLVSRFTVKTFLGPLG